MNWILPSKYRSKLKTSLPLLWVGTMALAVSVQAAYQGNPVKVFIFSGQSNMVGTGTNTDKAPESMRIQTNVLYDVTRADDAGTISPDWEVLGNPSGAMGPEVVSIGRFVNAFPNDQICAIKVSAPGTGIYYWKDAGQPGHDTLMARIDVVVARLDAAVLNGDIPSWTFDGFLWMQGENEANSTSSGPALAYEDDFEELVSKIRTKTATANLPVVLGRISNLLDPALGGPVKQPPLDIVRSNQVSWATNDAQGAWVDTDDLTLIDEWHFGNTAQVTIGNRFGEAWFEAAETRPRVTIVRSSGQADRSDGPSILYTATFSASVSGFTDSDVTVSGDTGGSVTVTEVAPNDGTTYQLTIQGMSYPGVVNVSIANAAATTGSLDSLPSFAEFTAVIWTAHQGVADLILYDPMTSVARSLNGADHGIGWAGNGWDVQSDRVGYQMESGTPLTYTNLLSSPGYATGGDQYVSSGRLFDLETTFRPWMTDKFAGAINEPGTTLWFSYLVRPQTANQKYTVSLNRGTGWGGGTPTATVERGADGDWHLIVLGTDIDTGVPVVLNQTDFMVLKLEIGGASNPSKTHLWINPNSDWLGGVAPADATATTSDSVTSADYTFARLYWMPGDQIGYSALDEVRLGTTFASVTPSNVEITEAPTAPTSLSATAISVSGIDLSWADTSGIESGFYIERGLTAGSLMTIATNAPNATSFSDSGLTHTMEYFYRVTAFNIIGSSTNNPTDSATTLVPAPPAAPSALQATGTSVSSINLTWSDNSNDETGFVIERKMSVTGPFTTFMNVAANTVSFSDTGLYTGITYTYRVKAINAIGDSGYTAQVEATTLIPSAPDAPSALQAIRASETSIDLSWTDNSNDETNFVIERKTTGAFAVLTPVAADVVSYSDTGLTTDVTYTYRVKATNANGDSTYTAEASATPTASSSSAIASQDFDGGATGTGGWTYSAGLDTTGDATTTSTGIQNGTATLNSTIDYGYDNFGSGPAGAGTLWLSYRLTMPAHSQWNGNSIDNAGFLREGQSPDTIGFKGSNAAGGAWGDYHYYITIGGAAHEDLSGDVFTYDQNTDLFVFGKFVYESNGNRTFSIASVNWADRATASEADLASGFSASWVDPHTGDFSGNTDRFIDSLTFSLNQPDATSSVTIDDIIAGNTAQDIGLGSPADPFDGWATAYGLTGVKTDDFDEDGMNDFYEYALGGNPTNDTDTGMLGYAIDTGLFQYIHGKRTDDASLVYTLVDQTNLLSGVSNTNAMDSVTSGPSGMPNFDSVTNHYDTTGINQQFFKLIIE